MNKLIAKVSFEEANYENIPSKEVYKSFKTVQEELAG